MKACDIIAITICIIILLATVFLCDQRGLEAASLQRQVAALEEQIQNMRPVPRITIERASVYYGAGEIVVERAR